MKIWKKKIGRNISRLYGVYNKFLPEKNGGLILMYHSVSSIEKKSDIYDLNKDLFLEHMSLINELGNTSPLSLKSLGQSCISVTFDDGYANNLDIAAPILEQLNIPFTVYVTSDNIKSNDKQYLSVSGLRELASIEGVSIGAHGKSHCKLADCGIEQLNHELIYSKKFIEDTISAPVESMSYPHGSVDDNVERSVENAGYDFAVSSCFGINSGNINKFRASRTDIWNNDTIRDFSAKINGNWDWMR